MVAVLVARESSAPVAVFSRPVVLLECEGTDGRVSLPSVLFSSALARWRVEAAVSVVQQSAGAVEPRWQSR